MPHGHTPMDAVLTEMGRLLDRPVDRLDPEGGLVEQGLDSSAAIELVEALNERLDVRLGVEVVFDVDTPAELAALVAEAVGPAEPAVPDAGRPLAAVLAEMGRLLGRPVDRLDPEGGLVEQGLDSSAAIELVEALNERLDVRLGVEVVFDVDTPAELAALVTEATGPAEPVGAAATTPNPPTPPDAPPPPTAPAQVSEPAPPTAPAQVGAPAPVAGLSTAGGDIAVVGLSARFADLPTPERLWQALRAGTSRIRELDRPGWPADYYDPDPAASGRAVSRWAGHLDRIDAFDAGFFRLSPREARRMDPQQRIFLQEAYHAFEDAGYAPQQLTGRRVGVFVGVRASDYQEQVAAAEDVGSQVFLGTDVSILAGRVSHLLGLVGPNLAVDTACSSSLVALHLACASIQRGESEMALAGGVFVAPSPRFLVLASKAEMLSPSGRVRSFHAAADGMVIGEGAGALLLKPLDAALRDGDHVYGVIRGTAVGHNGRTHSITTPATPAATELVRGLYRDCGVPMDTVQYLEVQGAGIRLGDSVELRALANAFGAAGDLVIGTHKGNIGHAIAAAGVAAVAKVLLAMRHREIPPTITGDPDGDTDLPGTPFRLTARPLPWPAPPGTPLRAGVNSFGFGGTNAHVVIEEPPRRSPVARSADDPAGVLVPISGRRPADLARRVADLLGWAERDGDRHPLADVAYTLQTGRAHFAHRLAVLARDPDDLRAALRAAVRDGDPAGRVVATDAGPGTDGLRALAAEYVSGGEVPWDRLWEGQRRHRVPLPTYPFAEESHWIGAPATGSTPPARTDAGRATAPDAPSRLLPPEKAPRLGAAERDLHERAHDELRRWAHDSIARMLVDNGALDAGGPGVPVEAAVARLGVAARHRRQWDALLDMLNRSGTVELTGDTVALVRPVPTAAELAAERARLDAAYREAEPFTRLLGVCFDAYARVLRDEIPATDVLFPGSSFALIQPLYQGHTMADLCNDTVAWAVDSYLEHRATRLAPGERVEIVEVGAGTGGTSRRVFAAVGRHAARLRYHYTDVSLAMAKFGAHEFGAATPYAEFGTLDVDRDVTTQGYPAGGIDVVVATNVLHATSDVRRTVANLCRLLRPGGWLVLNELSTTVDVIAMIVGQLDGWWRYEDADLRLPYSPVVPVDGWRDVLRDAGLTDVLVLGPPPRPGRGVGQNVVIAQQPAAVAGAEPAAPAETTAPPVRVVATAAPVATTEPGTGVREQIRACLALALETDAAHLADDTPFAEYGVDSLIAAELVNRINDALGTGLRTPDLYAHITVGDLAAHVLRTHPTAASRPVGQTPPDPAPVHRPAPTPSGAVVEPADRDVAVIGLSCTFPGSADAEEYWDNLVHGRTLFRDVPVNRWDVERFHDPDRSRTDTTYCRQGGFLDDIERFDALFFSMSGRDAEVSDPQHRLFLQEAWNALEDSGYAASAAGRRCGVFVGSIGGDYDALQEDHDVAHGPTTLLNNQTSTLSGRISYFLDLAGPNLAVDTACSSSLVAVHLACQSLLAGESELALAGGVFIATTPRFFVHMSQLGVLSPEHSCRPFDADADGFLPGEGVAAVVLKPLAAAHRDGDHIYGVIKGTAINHDGRTNGFTAPNARSQTALATELYARSGVAPDTVGFVEAHGTGTELGDPIEVTALTDAFRRHTQRRQFAAIGSVKANIGHTVGASGLAGLIKVLMAMRHGVIPPQAAYREANAYIDFASSPFYVPTSPVPWPASADRPRRATVSAFGFSGTNAMLLVQEAPPTAQTAAGDGTEEVLVPISARDDAALRRYARVLADHVDPAAGPPAPRLADVALTLRTRRSVFAERLVVGAPDTAVLADRLRRFAAGENDVPGVLRGTADPTAAPPTPSGVSDADGIARAWCAGATVDWTTTAGAGRVVPLPTYPFAGERYWAAPASPAAAPAATVRAAAAPPAAAPPAAAPPAAAPAADPAAATVHLLESGWQPAPAPAPPVTPGRTLLLGGARECAAARALIGALAVEGDSALLESAGDRFDGVLFLVPPSIGEDSGDPRRVARDLTASTLPVLRAVRAAAASPYPVRFVVAAGRRPGSGPDPCVAALGPLGRSLRLAAPHVSLTVVDVADTDDPAAVARAAVAEWPHATLPEVRRHGSERTVPILRPAPAPPTGQPVVIRPGAPCVVTGGGGGLGRLVARHLAGRYGARLLLLGRSPLDARIERDLADLTRLGAVRPRYAPVDVADPVQVSTALADFQAGAGPVSVVVHAAGALDQRALHERQWATVEATLRAKTIGTAVLDAATATNPLDAFVLFSSASSVVGDFGECDYSVANRFLDGFGDWRERMRERGLRRGATVVAQWGPWADGGMRLVDTSRQLYTGHGDLTAIDTAQGLAAFDRVLAGGGGRRLIVAGTPAGVRRLTAQLDPPAAPPPGVAGPAAPSGVAAASADDLLDRVLAEVRTLAAALLRLEHTPAVVEAGGLPPDEGLGEFGFDSLSLKDFADRLSERFRVTLSPTVFFSRSTLRKVAEYLVESEGAAVRAGFAAAPPVDEVPSVPVPAPLTSGEPPAPSPAAEHPASGAVEPVAVVGMAGRLPGSADLHAFWRHVRDGDDLVGEVPPERWDWRSVYSPDRFGAGRTRSRWGGFLPGVDTFDARFFGVSGREAELMDPQQRLLLQAAWSAVEDAGWRPSALSGTRTGVYVGAQFSDYQELLRAQGVSEPQVGTGTELTMLANRVSYLLGLRGPSEVVNTACSSSLVAVHRALTAIRHGDCDAAVVGGCNLILTPTYHVVTSQMGVNSPTGRCRTFDSAADGYVRGEGVLALVLKPLSAALRDGDHVYAVLRGSAVNHGGRAGSPTSPNADAQADVVATAWVRAGVTPESISYLETHGTGTELGDPVEVDGLRQAIRLWSERTGHPVPSGAWCGLGTVKTRIGHLEAASGLAGLVHVILSMRHRTLPGLLHLTDPNPLLRLDDGPFHLVDTTREWASPPGVPRRAGVSSFGFGGSNAHVVVEEHPPVPPRPAATPRPQAVVLSARTEERLRCAAGRLADVLRAQPGAGVTRVRATVAEVLSVDVADVDVHAPLTELGADPVTMAEIGRRLAVAGPPPAPEVTVTELSATATAPDGLPELADLAYTLQTGRDSLPERLAIVTADVDELAGLLRDFAGGADPSAVWRARVPAGAHRRTGEPPASATEAARAWLDGREPDWTVLHSAPRRIPLPGYPFAEDRYWLPAVAATGPERPHPLIDEDCSTPQETRFRVVLRRDAHWLADHVIAGRATLPGAAYAEVARAAAELADPDGRSATAVGDLLWARPIVVGAEPVTVDVALTPGRHPGTVRVEFRTGVDPVVHAMATVVLGGGAAAADPVDVTAITGRASGTVEGAEVYRRFRSDAADYGPAFRVVERLWRGDGEAVARLRLPAVAGVDTTRMALHPVLLDGAFQAVSGLLEGTGGDGGPLVPFAVREVRVLAPAAPSGYAYATRAAGGRFDIRLTDDRGQVTTVVSGLAARPLTVDVDDVRRRLLVPRWQPAPPVEPGPAPRRVLVLGDGDDRPDLVVAGFGAGFAELTPGRRYVLDPASAADLDRLLGRLTELDAVPDAVLHRWSEPAEAAYGPLLLINLCRALARLRLGARIVSVVPADVPAAVALAATARVVREEHRDLDVVVAQTTRPLSVAEALGELRVPHGEPEIRLGDGRDVLRWHGLDAPPTDSPPPWVRPGAVCLVTGASGGLGRLVVAHLVGAGARVVAMSRSAPADLDPSVLVVRGDVSVRADVFAAVAAARERFGGLDVVVHAAGVLRDGLVVGKSAADVAAVCAPKVAGTRWLDEATAELDLDSFVLFSSLSAVLGTVGQADYAYANRFLDEFAAWRAQRRPGVTVSLGWPLWADGGMTVDPDSLQRLRRGTGLVPLPADVGLAALASAHQAREPRVAVWYGEGRRGVPLPAATSEPAPAATPRPRSAPRDLTRELSQVCAEVLKVDVDELDPEEELSAYGLDSILMMTLLNRLEARFDTVVEPSAVSEYPTIASLAAHLAATVAPAPAPAAPAVVTEPVPAPDSSAAVIGMAGRFPGSPSVAALWENLLAARPLVSEVPADRWDADAMFDPSRRRPGTSYSKWAGFVDGAFDFDAGYFGVPEADAVALDPHQRLVLELAAELFADAGYRPDEVAGSRTGVFIGGGDSNYLPRNVDAVPPDAVRNLLTSTIPNMLAARVADFFDLRGPAQTIDTACSSALVAIHAACRALRAGECDYAVAGGVELLVDPYLHIAFSQAGALAPDGVCAVFDEGAHGLVLGEGGGLVLLRRVSDAVASGDRVNAVVLGGAVNNDGRTMGLTVPSVDGQEAVLRAALTDAGIPGESVGYLEAHGTGTLLGDPIEVRAASRVFGSDGGRARCGIGSVKSNLGHLMRAAGAVGFIKAVLAVRSGMLPATVHCARPHPRFRFADSPFFPVTATRQWPAADGWPRRAGVSAFGFGGTNAHVVVQEYRGAPGSRSPLPPPEFRRRRYRLGETAATEPGESLLGLLASVHDGRLDADAAANLITSLASAPITNGATSR
ncbi:SDR family NAD(P)-dependent oxidoreductase [Micromonospora sp. WMMD1120]|uniref:SDR family NAD(P)-dependent oxidoreductase n=1 Tax=Micromonospora sp. WMMD1120 TaxID=3016106 RepID=UPI002417E384|nr:SDR family NAD(P)-dependent oxidoreductase [Micromonospora sp. WMMD1120]MDG4810844.1 SDR family NAD(P)-dependent oxidoreductase [Micromonospora sp. WMMD1120]